MVPWDVGCLDRRERATQQAREPREASVARLLTTPGSPGYIQASEIGILGSLMTAWFPQKAKPRKTGAGLWRRFGTTTSR